jgi:hypothetical protein
MMRTSSGVTIAEVQPRRDTLMQELPRQAVVGQHNVGASCVTVTKARPTRDTLTQVSTYANEIEQTSWCSITSSNVLNILMIKNHFTFESKVTNKVVSGLVMSSSPHWMQNKSST